MTESAAALLGLAFLIMILIGYFSSTLILSDQVSKKLTWALSPALGMGICSFIFLVFRRPMFTVELMLLALTFTAWLRKWKRSEAKVGSGNPLIPASAAWLIGALAWVTLASVIWIDKGPFGEWDGWAIWSSHARYLYRAGPVWQQYIVNSAHPDYPLLQPAATARLWRYLGTDISEPAGVEAVLITISGVLVLAAGLWELRRSSLSFLIPMLLVGTPFYWTLGVWQYADLPLSVYILITLVLIYLYWERRLVPHLLLAAGFAAGCAAATKNEGLLFALVISFALLIQMVLKPVKGAARHLAMFFVGLLPWVATTLYFKLAVGAPSDIVNNRASGELLAKILDTQRYVQIGSAFLSGFGTFGRWAFGPWIVLCAFVLTWGINRRYLRSGGWIVTASAVMMMGIGYFAVYVISPLSLDYHLSTSLDRLMMHLWPSVLLLAGLAVETEPARRT